MSVLTVDQLAGAAAHLASTPAGAELLTELHLQAGLWRQLATVLGQHTPTEPPSGDPSPSAVTLADYVHQLSATAASSDEHVRSLAETCLRRTALAGSSEMDQAIGPVALTVTRVSTSGRDAVIITVNVPSRARPRFAGTAGQHITVHTEVNGVPFRRSYSLLRSPSVVQADGHLSFAVRREPHGRVSTRLVERTSVGDVLVLSPPAGVFRPAAVAQARHLLLLGAGSGVTPLISLAEDTLLNETDSQITFVQVERTRDDVIGVDLLEQLADTWGSRIRVVIEETSRFGRPSLSRLNELVATERHFGPALSVALVCGPHAFTELGTALAEGLGIHPDRILCESFVANATPRPHARPGGAVTVELADGVVNLDVSPGESILGAALRAGREHPYSCLSGSCGSCAARVLSGRVTPTSHEVLGQALTDAGWILACQASPQ